MAPCKRAVQSAAYFAKSGATTGSSTSLAKPNGKRAFLVDTLALFSKQAEAITVAITEVFNDSSENVTNSFVSKQEMQKSEMVQEANLSKLKSEVKSSQEHHFSILQRETEKLGSDIKKMHSELSRIRDEMTN